MLKKIKESIIVTISVLFFAIPVLAPVTVHAAACDPVTPVQPCSSEIRQNLCSGANLSATPDATACDNLDNNTTGAASSFNGILKSVINVFSLVVGIVAVLMIIFAGFRYITSGGKESNVGSAKNTILYAVIGLVIVALAQVIVRFVLNKATT